MPPLTLIAIETLGGGGAERVALDVARHWPRDHSEPLLLVCRAEGPLHEQVPANLRVVELGVDPSPWNSLTFFAALRRVLASENIVGAIAHMTPLNRMMLRAAACGIFRAPVVVVEHNDFARNNNLADMNPIRRRLMLQEISFLYQRASFVVGCGEGVAEQWRSLLGPSYKNVCEIRNPLDRKFVNVAAGQSVALTQVSHLPRPWLISAGRLVEQKGFADLIKAFALVGAGSLIIVGEGPLRQELTTLIAKLGLDGRALLPGFVEDSEHLLRCADLYVSSSLWEGYPLTLVEAYASGLPVVARDCDFGPREIVTPDRPGLLVKDFSVGALAYAIRVGLNRFPRFSPGTTVDLSENDPRFVAERYRRLFD